MVIDYALAPKLTPTQYLKRVTSLAIPVLIASLVIYPVNFFALAHLQLVTLFMLLALAVITMLFQVPVSSVGVSHGPVRPIAVATLYLFGPFAAIVVQVVAALLSYCSLNRHLLTEQQPGFELPEQRRSFMRGAMLNTSQLTVATGTTGCVYWMLVHAHAFHQQSLAAAFALSVVSVADFYINAVIITTMASKAYKSRWDIVWFNNYRWTYWSTTLLSPLGFIMGALTAQTPLFGLMFILIPLLAAHRGFALHERRLAVYRQGVDMLGRMMQEAHPYTHGHLHRVSHWAQQMALGLGVPPESMALIGDAAILHDIGKIAVDERILNKIGKLNDADWASIRTHPVIGSEIASQMKYLDEVALWIRHHHEKMDGTGYPDGLAGDQIPLESRIISVVDAFDAMVGGASKDERRPYREPLSNDAARSELVRCCGTQFDERVVSVFLNVLDKEQEEQEALDRANPPKLTLVSAPQPEIASKHGRAAAPMDDLDESRESVGGRKAMG
jgi:putative nucleotidyltransferase with HDIG domain